VKLLAEISVLAEGYVARLEDGKLRASPSAVLIEDAGTRILVDPGADKGGLLRGLSRKGIHPEDVDLLFVTHTHLDHILNLRLFPEADVCDSSFIYRGDEEIPYGKLIPGTKIEVVPTPGHSPDHASLLAPVGAEMWLVAGDLFWWWDDAVQRTDFESLMELEDESASDPAALRMSRMMALARADVVIPGHGKLFRPDRRSLSGLQ
jgi:glyoxylase-like metal-dependent hydrolase (beta-lactamase superfamily II)